MMKQLQFLGRTANDENERLLIIELPIIARSGMDAAITVEHLMARGLTPESAQVAWKDPLAFRRQMLSTVRDAPEAGRTLAAAGASARILDDVAAFGELVAGLDTPLLLDRCAIDDDGGSFQIAYYGAGSGLGAEDGDNFFGGITLQGNATHGTLRVAPRIVRQICVNGMTSATDQTGEVCVYTRDARGVARGEMGHAFETGLSRDTVRVVLERLQALRRRSAPDPMVALQREGLRVPRAVGARIRRVFEENGDPSAYGALNALTQTARDASTVAERVSLEQVAGEVLPIRRPTRTPPRRASRAPFVGK